MKAIFQAILVLGLVFSTSAGAHAELTSTTPGDGAVLSESPATIAVTFSAPVRLAKVLLRAQSDKAYTLDFSVSMTPKTQYTIGVQDDLPTGVYTVHWTAMGGDGHKISDTFSFEVN